MVVTRRGRVVDAEVSWVMWDLSPRCPSGSTRTRPNGSTLRGTVPRREGWASAADAVRVITGVCSARKGTEGDRGIEE
ncbi:hypothetical protein GCM10010512_15450 [Streptomyces thermoviolaceus subsp. thermoviolaceus]|nr:hypothetical protein GCM10010512_15450 [Streptomyces thermoviolaceus subsp. thermoviolaceus]